MPPTDDGSSIGPWGEWSRHVLAEIERLNGVIEKLQGEDKKSRADVANLRTDVAKAGVRMGLVIGIVTIIASVVASSVVGHFAKSEKPGPAKSRVVHEVPADSEVAR